MVLLSQAISFIGMPMFFPVDDERLPQVPSIDRVTTHQITAENEISPLPDQSTVTLTLCF